MLYLHYTVAFHTGPGKERKKKKLKDKTNNQAMNTEPTKKQTKTENTMYRQKFNYHYSRRI